MTRQEVIYPMAGHDFVEKQFPHYWEETGDPAPTGLSATNFVCADCKAAYAKWKAQQAEALRKAEDEAAHQRR